LKDKLSKNKAVLFGFIPAAFFILYGFELIQWLFIYLSNQKYYSLQFYGIWINVNLLEVDASPTLLIPLSIIPIILSILFLELSAINKIVKKLNSVSVLVFQLLILTYLLMKVIISSILPLIYSNFYNDISIVLKFYEYNNSLKYINVLFVVFAFIIYFNRLTAKITKKINNNKRGLDGKTK
jgi:hypothetical protein